jgi:predicted ArsR family transcriptional regulator
MFLPGFRELVKEGWVKILDELKVSGGLPIPELGRRLEASYMGVKDQCDKLVKLGYLERWRLPRQEVGRPEILYRLTAKADAMFPQAGVGLSLELLDAARALFGDTAPERLLLHYFGQLRARWLPKLGKAKSLVERATMLSALREKEGCFGRCKYDAVRGFRIEEYHHPLQAVFAVYPGAVNLELRMMEELLGSRIVRREVPGGRGGPARVDYEVATLGVRESS